MNGLWNLPLTAKYNGCSVGSLSQKKFGTSSILDAKPVLALVSLVVAKQ